MFGLNSLDALYVALLFLVPGFVLSAVRNQFSSGREVQGNEQFLKYLSYSAINYSVCGPAIYYVLERQRSLEVKALLWLSVGLVVPAVLGAISGVSSQKGWVRAVLLKCGFHPVHYSPTAWDYLFGKSEHRMLRVTLKDDTRIVGYWGADSFASSEIKERDLLLCPVYQVDDDGTTKRLDQGVLILGAEIRTVEFWRPTRGCHEQEAATVSDGKQGVPAAASAQ